MMKSELPKSDEGCRQLLKNLGRTDKEIEGIMDFGKLCKALKKGNVLPDLEKKYLVKRKKNRLYSSLHFKYRFLKRARLRAITFREQSNTPEKREAWDEVITWLNSFLDPRYRTITKNGGIGLDIDNSDIEQVFRSMENRK